MTPENKLIEEEGKALFSFKIGKKRITLLRIREEGAIFSPESMLSEENNKLLRKISEKLDELSKQQPAKP